MIIKAFLWGVLAFVVGGCVTWIFFGWFWIGALFFGIAAFVSAKNNQGKPPRWLWRSKENKEK